MHAILIAFVSILTLIGCAGSSESDSERVSASSRTESIRIDSQERSHASAERPRRRSVSVEGVTLSILEAGTGDPIIYVHGVVTTSNIFPNYLDAFSPNYRGIAVDLRGYGDSQKPPSGFTIDQFATDLIKLADQLGIEKPVWVGVSMGGMILQRLALDYPDRVRALVLVSTTDGAMILDKNIETIGAPRDYQKVSQTIIAESFPPGTEPALYQPLIDRIPTWNATVLREALGSMSRFDVHGQLSQIHVPTLIMVGAKDDVATTAIAKGIHEQIPDSRLAEFHTGHFIMAEDPDAFQAVLGEFLNKVKAERS